jgi:hypothetical protein
MNTYKCLYRHWIEKAREMERTFSRLKYLKEIRNHRTFPKFLSRFQQNYSKTARKSLSSPDDAQDVGFTDMPKEAFQHSSLFH